MKIKIDSRLLINTSVKETIDVNGRTFNNMYIKRFTRNLAHFIDEPVYNSIFKSCINPKCYHVPNYHEAHLKKLLK